MVKAGAVVDELTVALGAGHGHGAAFGQITGIAGRQSEDAVGGSHAHIKRAFVGRNATGELLHHQVKEVASHVVAGLGHGQAGFPRHLSSGIVCRDVTKVGKVIDHLEYGQARRGHHATHGFVQIQLAGTRSVDAAPTELADDVCVAFLCHDGRLVAEGRNLQCHAGTLQVWRKSHVQFVGHCRGKVYRSTEVVGGAGGDDVVSKYVCQGALSSQ